MTELLLDRIPEFINALSTRVRGELRTDPVSRVLYSTDASIYQIEPLGVFFPKHSEEISDFMEAANEFDVPLLPRGAGSSLAGQAIGPGFIIDCSRHLDQIIEINPEKMSAIIEPGLILSELNRSTAEFGLQFGPDPASEERATIGGVIANNATGAHSIQYGMAADHVLSLDTTLADGSQAHLKEISLEEAELRAATSSREGEIYQAALSIRREHFEDIIASWPKTWRKASGYNLNYLLPWSPSSPPHWENFSPANQSGGAIYPPVNPGSVNLASLIAGSEGTLGIIRQAEIRLVPKPRLTCLVLLAYEDLISACDEVSRLLEFQPSAIELIPGNMIKLARKIPSFAKQAAILDELVGIYQEFPNLLAVEFSSSSVGELKKLSQKTVELSGSPSLIVADYAAQKQVWNVRKVGLGILMSVPGDLKPIPFVEDISVPVNKLSQFVSEFESIMAAHETKGDFYAHASAGCLHIRPLIDLKQETGIKKMRSIANATINLISNLGGAPSGEHGDGIARSEWLGRIFGSQIIRLFENYNEPDYFDQILNPGKIIDPVRMDENLRFGMVYSARSKATVLDFSQQDGYTGAIEMCNGAGVCRKLDGVMCPSFQATRDEMHSTRGRANLLRSMLQEDQSNLADITPEDVLNALDLCLACKGCKSECPSAVDMAKIRYEFLDQYYETHKRPLRDYLFAYIGEISHAGAIGKPVANIILSNTNLLGVGQGWLGISGKRSLPRLINATLQRSISTSTRSSSSGDKYPREPVLYLSDPFTEYFQPDIGIAARQILTAAGCEVHSIPVVGAGRTKLSKGFLKAARQHAEKVIAAVSDLDPAGSVPVIGVEPSEIYTLKDEYPDLFPGEAVVESLANRAYMLDEYLLRAGKAGKPRVLRIDIAPEGQASTKKSVFLHGHCYQKSQPPAVDGFPVGVHATQELLEQVGYRVELIDAGCCGMAGAFGYELEHYDLSMEIGELALFPQVRQVGEGSLISACGFSCMSQIKDGTGVSAKHFVSLVHDRLIEKIL